MRHERHEAHVYKKADGTLEIVCQTPKCRFQLDVTNYAGKPGDYAMARQMADSHSAAKFR